MERPAIDLDIAQVNAEIETLRRKLLTYLTKREEQRYDALLRRMRQLERVIAQRNKEHEGTSR
jgi:hypothetical protein